MKRRTGHRVLRRQPRDGDFVVHNGRYAQVRAVLGDGQCLVGRRDGFGLPQRVDASELTVLDPAPVFVGPRETAKQPT